MRIEGKRTTHSQSGEAYQSKGMLFVANEDRPHDPVF